MIGRIEESHDGEFVIVEETFGATWDWALQMDINHCGCRVGCWDGYENCLVFDKSFMGRPA